MKRLQRPTSTYRQDVESVLSPRQRRSRRAAIGIATQQAAQYSATSPDLQGMKSQLATKPSRELFLKLYKSRKKAVAAIKSRVRACLDNVTAAECQYCSGLAPPSTFDHFLEKAAVPELSLFAPNLIPCCPDCNNLRGATFAANGERSVLHFYDDDVDTLPELLVANISAASGVPSVRFSVAPSPHPLRQVFQRHFDALHLATRYATKAASQLLLIKTKARSGSLDQSALSRTLVQDADDRNAVFGRNDHLATLFRSVAASPPTLDWAVQP